MKIVINRCYGGFGLSDEAVRLYAKYKGGELTVQEGKYGYTEFHLDGEYFYDRDLERDDEILVQVVEELGECASGHCADLKIVEIPDNVQWEIDNYDGLETIHEFHRSWG